MLEDIVVGPFRIRIDFLLIPIGVALATQVPIGVGFSLAILVHEFAHALAKRVVSGEPFVMFLQVGGGGSYIRSVTEARAQTIVLVAGPIGTLVLASVAHVLVGIAPMTEFAWWAASARFTALLWTGFQALPFPTLDGGLLLRRYVVRRFESATLAWRVGWLFGFTVVVLIVTIEFDLLPWALWLTLMAVLLGRAEAAYVRHVDAFTAWERGDYRTVLALVHKLPESTKKRDAMPLYDLGIAAALQLEDEKAVEDLASKMPAHHPSALGAAEWLLRRGRAYGAKIAEHALDALDAERVKPADIHHERFADVTFRYAIHEATGGRFESALGLLERAAIFGFDDVDRLRAEASFESLRGRPRYEAVVARVDPGRA